MGADHSRPKKQAGASFIASFNILGTGSPPVKALRTNGLALTFWNQRWLPGSFIENASFIPTKRLAEWALLMTQVTCSWN